MSNTQESYPTQTTGLGVAAKIAVAGNLAGGTTVPGYNDVTLSLSGATYAGVTYPTTFQLNPNLEDVSGAEISPGTSFALTQVANSSGNTAVYTGTIVATANSLKGQTFVVAGFTTPANNGTFIATANNGTTTITLENAVAVAQSGQTATAVSQELGTNELTFVSYGFKTLTGNTYTPSGSSTAVATVNSSGLITSVAVGQTVVEVSYPTFNNTVGLVVSSGNIMNGLPINKIYAEVNVQVLV